MDWNSLKVVSFQRNFRKRKLKGRIEIEKNQNSIINDCRDINYKFESSHGEVVSRFEHLHHESSNTEEGNHVASKWKYYCHLCPYCTNKKTNIERHINVHMGVKPYQCSHCPRAFTQKRDLNIHLLCHTGIQPFTCEICHCTYATKSQLNNHRKIHF